MALPSTYQLHHSLPNRSPSQRPRSLSLSEYQPLNFDRDALESAYQASLGISSSHSSSLTGHGGNSNNYSPSLSFGGASLETHETSLSEKSNLYPKYTNGSVNIERNGEEVLTHPRGAFAGVGAGHTLTPPQSPLHQATSKLNQATLLTPIPQSPSLSDLPSLPPLATLPAPAKPPTPPPRPNDNDIPETTLFPRLPPRPPIKPTPPTLPMRRSQSEVDMIGQWENNFEWIEGDGNGRGKRRALPAIPNNVPVPAPPQWEPDYKPQIPSELTAPSAQYAYASLSAPPPNLPPRRNQRTSQIPQSVSMGNVSTSAIPFSGPSGYGAGPSTSGAGPSNSRPPMATGPSAATVLSSTSGSSSAQRLPLSSPPVGAPDFPPLQSSATSSSSHSNTNVKPRREAEKEVLLRAQDRMLIWSTHYLDPSLKQSIINVPSQVTNALSGFSSNNSKKYDGTVGLNTPIDGLAKLAKDWVVTPDARFLSEHGGVELGLGIINSNLNKENDNWTKDKGRKKARVEVSSRTGGIKVDIIELDKDRQIDLKIETRSGDVLVLLPEEFHGPIHITSSRPPETLSTITPLLKPINNPYSSFYTTFMIPQSLSQSSKSVAYNTSASLNQQIDSFDQLYSGYINHSRIDHSKISIRSDKGRVVLAMKNSKDEMVLDNMGLRVGVKSGEVKKRRWWRM